MPFAWVGCCNLEAFDTKYHPVITALCAGGKRFKKLKNYVEPTFRVKINYADRLIFRTKIINKEPYIELISIVKKHDYKRPEPVAQLSSAMLNEENAIICMPEDEAFESEPLGARLYCRNELIQLNDTQKSITLEQTPLVLSGGGGSGKTLVGMELMRQMIHLCHSQSIERARIVFVTRSRPLAQEQREEWGATNDDVSFLSYNEFVLLHDPSITGLQLVGYDAFFAWSVLYFQSTLKSIKTRLKGETGNTILNNQYTFFSELQKKIPLLYEEMRAMPHTQEEYNDYGVRQSIFLSTNVAPARTWLFQINTAYQAHLKNANQWDPVFHTFIPGSQYHFIFVDEALDLSYVAWKMLLHASHNHQLCFALDTHQRLDTRLSLRPLLLSMLHQVVGRHHHERLPGSYRCPPQVLQVANVFIALKQRLAGGISDSDESTEISLVNSSDDTHSSVNLYHSTEAPFDDLRALCESPQCIVITHAIYLEKARALFNTQFVGTPAMLKGLEKDTVIFYQATQDEADLFSASHAQLAILQSNNSPQHKAARHNRCLDFECIYNEIIVAVTRTKKQLYIIDDHIQQLPHIFTPLSHVLGEREVSEPDHPIMKQEKQGSEADWLMEVHRLLKDEATIEVAKNIYCKQLGYSAEDFELLHAHPAVLVQPHLLKPILPAPSNTAMPPHKTASLKSTEHHKKNPSPPSVKHSPCAVIPSISPDADTSKPSPQKRKKVLDWSETSDFLLPSLVGSERVMVQLHFLYNHFTDEQLKKWFKTEKQVFDLLSIFSHETSAIDPSYRFIDAVLQSTVRRKTFCQFLERPDAVIGDQRILDILQEPRYGIQLLQSAVLWNAREYVELCLDENIPSSDADLHYRTPFYFAMFYGRLNMARVLLDTKERRVELFKDSSSASLKPESSELSMSPSFTNSEPYHSLAFTVFSNEWVFTINSHFHIKAHDFLTRLITNDSVLIEHLDVLAATEQNTIKAYGVPRKHKYLTPLMNAIIANDKKTWLQLINNPSTDINESIGETTALLVAIQCGCIDVVCELIRERVEVNSISQHSMIPLVLAAQCGHRQIVRALLSAGAYVNEVSCDGITPILTAIYYSRASIVSDLLSYGATLPRNQELRVNKEISDITIQHEHYYGVAKELFLLLQDTKKLPRFNLSDWIKLIPCFRIRNVMFEDSDTCFLEEIFNDKQMTLHCIRRIKLSEPKEIDLILQSFYNLFRDGFENYSMFHIAARTTYGNVFLMFCASIHKTLSFTSVHPVAPFDPIWEAVRLSNVKTMEIFLLHGASVLPKPDSDFTLLEYAVRRFLSSNIQSIDVERAQIQQTIVEALLKHPEIIQRIQDGDEALAVALMRDAQYYKVRVMSKINGLINDHKKELPCLEKGTSSSVQSFFPRVCPVTPQALQEAALSLRPV